MTPASAAYQVTAAPSWVPNGTVYAVAKVGSTVYLGGDFTSLTDPVSHQTASRSHLAAVDATTGAPTSWNPGADGSVRTLAVGPSGTVYAGGTFTRAAGVAATRLAAITAAGRAVTGFTASAGNTVRDVLVDSTGLYVAGAFGNVNGTVRSRVARLNPSTGAVVTGFDAKVAGGNVYSLARSGTSLLLGGSFTSVSGLPRVASAAVSTTTGVATSWAPAALCSDCPVLDLATNGTNVYEAIGGAGNRAAAFSLSTGKRVWATTPGDGDAQAIAVVGSSVYVGGHFTTFAGVKRPQLVALDAAGGALAPYSVTFTGSNAPGVWSILADSTALRLGGGFLLSGNPAARYATFPLY